MHPGCGVKQLTTKIFLSRILLLPRSSVLSTVCQGAGPSISDPHTKPSCSSHFNPCHVYSCLLSGVPQVFIAPFLNLVRTPWPISKLLPLPHFPPNSSLHQAAREARNKAREVEGPPWARAGLRQGSGWVMPLTWWFGGGLYNREFTGIRRSLTSVPICRLPTTSPGKRSQCSIPRSSEEGTISQKGSKPHPGGSCWIYLWRLPTQHIRIFSQSTFLPNLESAQQTQYCKTGYSQRCFLLNLKSSFITLLIPDGRKRPSPVLFTLCSRQSPIGQLSTELLGRWPVHTAHHGRRRPWGCLPSARTKYPLLGCWRNWQLMETKPWVTRMCTRP